MKIAVVNDIHVGRRLEHNGQVRASSHLVEEILENFLQGIIRQHSPEVLINLGDLIRSEEKGSDLAKSQSERGSTWIGESYSNTHIAALGK